MSRPESLVLYRRRRVGKKTRKGDTEKEVKRREKGRENEEDKKGEFVEERDKRRERDRW